MQIGVRNVVCAFVRVMAIAGLMSSPAVAQDAVFAVRNVRVFDGTRVIQNGTVVVQGGKISAVGGRKTKVPKGIEVIDGTGKTLLPGLIDAHVHFVDSGKTVGGAALVEAMSYGITTVMDLATANAVDYQVFRKRVKDGEFPNGADLFTAGPGAVPAGGRGGVPVAGPEDAKAWVDAHKAGGADYIKIFFDDAAERGGNAPILSHDTAAAIIAAAHQDGFLTIAHTMQEKRARELVSLGLDGLVHISPYEMPSADFGQFLASHDTFQSTNMIAFAPSSYKIALAVDPDLSACMPSFLIQTLTNAKGPGPGAKHENSVATFRELHAAHVLLMAGTDAFYPYPPLLHAELEIMVKDGGMSPVEALAAATSNTALAYHMTDRGRIAQGLRADLLLVSGDPTQNILETRKIYAVWREGRKIDRDALKQEVTHLSAPAGR